MLAFVLLFTGVACSDDGATPASTEAGPSTLAPGATNAITGDTLDTQTTFMADCGQMPTPADLSAIVGIPLDIGRVIGPTSCEFLGLNDQSRFVALNLYLDAPGQTSFLEEQASLGGSVALNDLSLQGAMVATNGLVYVTANGAVYSVLTMVNDTTPAEQVPLSVTVLQRWLAL